MSGFWRSLFGSKKAGNNRKVIGLPKTIPVNELPYIQDSAKRLQALQQLCVQFKNTPHALQIEQVYHKTKRIHAYLSDRGRGHELELFHLQHTDHFLNTFNVILNVHQQHHEVQQPVLPKPPKSIFDPFKRDQQKESSHRSLNRNVSRQVFEDTRQSASSIPKLAIPQIALNTYSKIVYLKEETADVKRTCEVGYTSDQDEKNAFIRYVSDRLGIHTVSYIGNTMVYFPGQGHNTAELVPVIHWNHCLYVVCLEEVRLYPVSTLRKRT